MQYIIIAASLVILGLCYTSYLVIERLYISPIAGFPGPRLAALTFWFEFFHDVILGGQYTKEILRMHQKYGPIVRINPYELHINDPDFYDTIYCLGKRVNKWDWSYRGFAIAQAAFGTLDHDLHHARRTPLAALFSKRAVAQLEPLIKDYIDKLVARFDDLRGSAKSVNLFHAFSALTGDIISDYSFGVSQGLLDTVNFAPEWHNLWIEGNAISLLLNQFGNGESVLKRLPKWLSLKLYPLQLVNLKRRLGEQLILIKEENNSGEKAANHRTIFHEVFESDLPPAEKTVERLMDDTVSVMAAGTVTTTDTLSVIAYHLISKPNLRSRLQKELREASRLKLQLALADLEHLPYLTAVIKEGLRTSYGVASRLPRIFPDDAIQFNDWTIPPGTPVSMSCLLMHDDPDVFQDPKTFNPDRWLSQNAEAGARKLERYLVPFSRGTRQCLGMNLAYAEMYLTLTTLFTPGRFDFHLFETTDADVEVVADNFIAAYRKESKGVRVTID